MRVFKFFRTHTAVHGLVGDVPTNVSPDSSSVTLNTGPVSLLAIVITKSRPKCVLRATYPTG